MRPLLSLATLTLAMTWPMLAQAPDSQPEPGRLDKIKARGAGEILTPGKQWELVAQGYQLTAESTVDKDGIVYFSDARKNRILKIDLDGNVSIWKEGSNGTHGVAFGPDGRLYAGQHDRKRIVAFSSDGTESVITEGVQSHHLTVTSRNALYMTDPPRHTVLTVDATGHKRVVHEGLNWPRGVRASADGSLLVVNDARSTWVWTFKIQRDGSLSDDRRFCRLETSNGAAEVDAGGMVFDSKGFLYVATKEGVQVCDQQGRVSAIIDIPGNEGASAVFFGGRGLQWLYVTDGDKLYRRLAKRRGAAIQGRFESSDP
jgi:gluconolactonase